MFKVSMARNGNIEGFLPYSLNSFKISWIIYNLVILVILLSISNGEKLVIKSYDSGACIHVSGKNVSVQPCVWKPHNSTKKPYRLTHELLAIHPFDMEDDLNAESSSSSEEALLTPNSDNKDLSLSYYLIRVKQNICLLALDNTVIAGQCRAKRSKFLIRSGPSFRGSSFKFTIETPSGKCLTWDGTGNQLYQRTCHLRGLHKLWIFCKQEGDCGIDPSHPTFMQIQPGGNKVTSVSTSVSTPNQTVISTTTESMAVVVLTTPVPTELILSSTLSTSTVSGSIVGTTVEPIITSFGSATDVATVVTTAGVNKDSNTDRSIHTKLKMRITDGKITMATTTSEPPSSSSKSDSKMRSNQGMLIISLHFVTILILL